jgi:hypothetical protein
MRDHWETVISDPLFEVKWGAVVVSCARKKLREIRNQCRERFELCPPDDA